MHFGVAQRFAALIAGARQTSVKLRAEASAGLPRSVRGYAGLQRGIASQCQGVCRLVARDDLGTWGGFVLCTARRAFVRFRGAGAHRGACVLRPSAARSFAFGELAHIKGHAFCVQAARVSIIWAVTSDCMTKCRDYEFRVLDPSALFAKKSQKNCEKVKTKLQKFIKKFK